MRGDIDVRELLVAPQRAAEPGAPVKRMTIGELLEGERGVKPDAWALLGVDPSAPLEELDDDQRAWIADLLTFWKRVVRPAEVSQETSPHDYMYAKTPDGYFSVGAAALRSVRLAMLADRKETCDRVLDFACGYGRVLRFFKEAFPDAELVACDIIPEAVDFCAEALGATPVHSHEDPARIDLHGKFDLIWVGSLFTHLSGPRWGDFLDLLESVLAVDGLLVFTTLGRHVAGQLQRRELEWPLSDEGIERILRDFDERGFGYVDWGDPATGTLDWGERDYGTSLSRPSWVCEQLERRAGLRLISFREQGWGRQDVVTCRGAEA